MFEEDYYTVFTNQDEARIDYILAKLPYIYPRITFKRLLLAQFNELVLYAEISAKGLLPYITWLERDFLSNALNYDMHRKAIAAFFMRHSIEMDLKTCYYCNIEFINTFINGGEYRDSLDFVLNSTDEELEDYLGEDKARLISEFLQTNTISQVDDLRAVHGIGPKTILKLNIFNTIIVESKNHFTLDHFIPKGDYYWISLSLYNLVPSCYSCNSKFKKTKQYPLGDYLKYISPTSVQFDLQNNLVFKLYFNVLGTTHEEKINNTTDFADFIIRPEIKNSIDPNSKKYLDIFKIRGRYRFHKYQAMKMIENRKKYPDSEILEIANLVGKSVREIKQDIFGSVIFNISEINEPLAIYKIHIATQLGII